jgi:hypothetical protein
MLSSPNLYSEFVRTIKKNDTLSFRGGTGISQIEKSSQRFICPNQSCRKTFTKPIKTFVVGISEEAYNACPHCLTPIPADLQTTAVEAIPKAASPVQVQAISEKQSDASQTPSECKNYFGYLGARSGKEIPDDCLTCKLIVQCMMKSQAQ